MNEDSLGETSTIYLNKKNWLKEFEYIKIHENDLNEVLMNYFCVHRMYDVALEFQKETNIKPDMPIETVKLRYLIQDNIMNNKIEEAIEHINNLDERILKKHKDLIFYLKKQKLLKLILNNNISEAIIYSQQELAPYVNEKPSLINEIDDIMMLMAYPNFNSDEAKKLIQKLEKKKSTLKRIDDIILNYYNVDSESTFEYIVKNAFFTQNVLSAKYPCSIPKLKNLKNGYIEYFEQLKKNKKKKKKKSEKNCSNKKKASRINIYDKSFEENPRDFNTAYDEYRSM
ncbi:RanBPM and CLTH-like protein, putative [Plasmodium berghei]|uniref:RanBPM and CLTH-like protein, putative n=2 Tax=Plasmodium berghei TaxID=5821 RepID=A0A509ARB3_PLABA|nr:RanBPM and CLTH-like protein, putative [Plasmodium berghei ANKA]CXJ01603.1 RanBPM and CLTH-like protein, putative [Plasmodium berghei]SCL98202.1 RanBPM and CLTH-like protein, putative [Plasmodium berghei]SCM16776.1 RanBPM and CLTH-like protein, putative [Plasmodium berghei]SCM18574.1 RanBPM and CLTH-like protein, putative [Plasmodium berghei]VUC57890.1 RanBPM and CLTH-like protein, putative [Plasmodium berghei ANKA]|eukprot:XP_034423660.1 RanBPM and CLTH-like protein, putative [Plasmodium berghei ANKA]